MGAAIAEETLVGLTQRGSEIWFALRAVFLEYLEVPEGGGEPGLSRRGLEAFIRGAEGIWRRLARFEERDPLHDDVLGELTDRPRRVRDLVRRLVRKGSAGAPGEIRQAISDLIDHRVFTTDPARIWVVGVEEG
jgi:hypothetical protein